MADKIHLFPPRASILRVRYPTEGWDTGWDTAIPPPNQTAETAVNVGLTVLANVYPPWSTALAGAAKIAMMIWNAIDGAFRDTFHPNPLQAEEWLSLFRIDPGLLFAGVDNVKTPEQAARLVRYFKLVSGEHPMKKGWGLHNPNDASPDNPYQNSVDPTDPLTDPKYLQHIHDIIWRTKRAVSAHHNIVDYTAAGPAVVTKETAQRLLGILRHGMVKSGIASWSEVQDAGSKYSLRVEIKRVRKLAGESGPDPVLSKIFGDVSLPRKAA